LQLKNPIFFEPEKERGNLQPTVYTLWKCPQLLPALTTHPLVHEKLANGADLVNPRLHMYAFFTIPKIMVMLKVIRD
jgi:translation initiation factor 2D